MNEHGTPAQAIAKSLRIAADVWDKPGMLRNAGLAELLRNGAETIDILARQCDALASTVERTTPPEVNNPAATPPVEESHK